VLANAPEDGLNADSLGLAELQTMLKAPEATPQLDTHLTYSVVGYVSQLCFGRVHTQTIDSDPPTAATKCDVPQMVHDAIQQNTVQNLAAQLSPAMPEYQNLKSALKTYREIAAQGGWAPLSNNKGKSAVDNADTLAHNLALLGDLESAVGNEVLSTEDLKEGVKRFQSRHGLEPDGVLNKNTLAALSIPVEQRIEQIQINLDRMRRTNSVFEPRHLRVNIPAFHLSVHEGDEIPLEMRVIVGSDENRTPMLDSQIEFVVFSPYWHIPLSIATKELLPKIQQDSNYLRKQNIEVMRRFGNGLQTVNPSMINWHSPDGLDYQLRQKPGPTNTLGLVKFIFPNPYSVYLHDTPTDNLFDRLTRTLSHGCVRVESPRELANYLLRDQTAWSAERIESAMHAGQETHVPLKSPLPIHILYWTAWADAAGKVQFRKDVYGYDEKHQQNAAIGNASLPASNAAHIDMNKVGVRVVANAAGFHSESSLPH
jgi:murein L,D-transpeptidase YcbB/YkuD